MNYPKEVKEHMKWAKKQGLCVQCIHPWFDGICSCGNHIQYKERMNKIATIAIEIEDQHYKLQKEKTDKWLGKRHNQILKKTVQNPKWMSKLNSVMECGCCEGVGGHFANTNGKTTKIPCPNCNGRGTT